MENPSHLHIPRQFTPSTAPPTQPGACAEPSINKFIIQGGSHCVERTGFLNKEAFFSKRDSEAMQKIGSDPHQTVQSSGQAQVAYEKKIEKYLKNIIDKNWRVV